MMNTMLQYYLHIPDPDLLSDEEWAAKIIQLKEIRKLEKENSTNEFVKRFGQ